MSNIQIQRKNENQEMEDVFPITKVENVSGLSSFLERIGTPNDSSSSPTLFGRLKQLYEKPVPTTRVYGCVPSNTPMESVSTTPSNSSNDCCVVGQWTQQYNGAINFSYTYKGASGYRTSLIICENIPYAKGDTMSYTSIQNSKVYTKTYDNGTTYNETTTIPVKVGYVYSIVIETNKVNGTSCSNIQLKYNKV